MCRFAAYRGPSRPLSTLLYDPPHSLEAQAYAPREMLHGTVNVDGTGVAWWPDPDPTPGAGGEGPCKPLRYVTAATPWGDTNLPHLAPRLGGRVQLAAVRSATPGLGFGAGAVSPFVRDGVAFTHNGWVGGYREGTLRALLASLPDDLADPLAAATDSAAIFLVIGRRLARGEGLVDATIGGLGDVAAACRRADQPATLNVALADGREIVATRCSVGAEGNSLYTLQSGAAWPDAALVASERLDDDPAWEPVADDTLVHVTGDGVRRMDPDW